MYKIAGKKLQKSADKAVAAPVSQESLQLSTDEQYEMLKRELQDIELKILRGDGDKRQLGKRKFKLQAAITAIKPKRKMHGLSQIFMEEARRLLPIDKYNEIEMSAQHIWNIRNPLTRNDPIGEQVRLQAEALGVDV